MWIEALHRINTRKGIEADDRINTLYVIEAH